MTNIEGEAEVAACFFACGLLGGSCIDYIGIKTKLDNADRFPIR